MRIHVTKRNDTNTYIYITVVDNEISINSKLRYLFKCLKLIAQIFFWKKLTTHVTKMCV